MLYFDNAATTMAKEEVIEAMMPYFCNLFYNPSSPYARVFRDMIQDCRQEILKYLNSGNGNIYFTSGGSESNSWAIQGLIKSLKQKPIIITTRLEHKSVIETAIHNSSIVLFCKVDKSGKVDKDSFRDLLKSASQMSNPIIVSIQFANNEIGTIQDIKELANLTHEYRGIFHTDATQAFGKTHIDVDYMDIDLLTASGHKIGTPKGIGFLYVRRGIEIEPIIYGTQNDGKRGGTENVPYIIGLRKAITLLPDFKKSLSMNVCGNREWIGLRLSELGCTINGVFSAVINTTDTLYNILSVTLPENIMGESVVYLLSGKGIFISTGSACDSLSKLPSQTLTAIGLNQNEIRRTIRISFDNPTKEEMEMLVYEIGNAIERLRI